MREHRSAVLDVPRDASHTPRVTAWAPQEAPLERPLSSRIPAIGRTRGPVLMAPAGGSKAAGATGAGGTGSFFRACILLLLAEQPAHGYDVLERLTRFGFDSGDSGWLYRTLRAYEREKVLDSTWQISASGPPRRVYSLTDHGRDLLDAWAGSLRSSRRGIDEFLDRHGRALAPQTPGDE
ncbi:MAG: helix-turn-helix transcriptional regulator [Candidatus Limnocylindrales bacterium]